MAIKTLDQPVHANDLVLVYSTSKEYMLVRFAPADPQVNPPTSSVIVEPVTWHITGEADTWVLEGPDAYYIPSGLGQNLEYSDESLCYPLDYVLDFLNHPNEAQSSQEDSGFTFIVKPHGRDVLKHYFKGRCPTCVDKGTICPGCGDTYSNFPKLYGGCGADQACPTCMGYDFAIQDKRWIAELDRLEERLYAPNGHPRDLTNDQLETLRDRAALLARQRYENINARRQEMDIPLVDVDRMVDGYKDIFRRRVASYFRVGDAVAQLRSLVLSHQES